MLKRRDEISRRLKEGAQFRGEYMTLTVVPCETAAAFRDERVEALGKRTNLTRMAVLARKKCGRANKRVRLKRLVREFFRLNQNLFVRYESVIFSLDSIVKDESDFKKELARLSDRAQKHGKNCE